MKISENLFFGMQWKVKLQITSYPIYNAISIVITQLLY